MDPNLEDSLTMESIENMDFDHSGVVVNQEDIILEDTAQASNISMDLDTIDEQPALLGPNNEEVIVSDYIGEQFGFQEYNMQGENSSGANITIEADPLSETMTGQNEQTIDLQYADCVGNAATSKSSFITIKTLLQQRGSKKAPIPASTYPRQVAIAPKPSKGAANVQYAIAPRPVALTVNKNAALTKTIPMKNVVQNIRGNTVLAQIGKQLVMVPAGSTTQKIKFSSLLPTASTDSSGNQIQIVRRDSDSAQLIANKGGKPIRTKFIVQAQPNADPVNQPAVITKLVPVTTGTASQARYVMQQKTVPLSKVVLTPPSKQTISVAPKKQIISIKSQSPKVVTSQGNVQTKRVVITANQPQSQSVEKAAGNKSGAPVVKDNNTVQQQRTLLHPINVPGKGIQFIKLVTNQSASSTMAVTSSAAPEATSATKQAPRHSLTVGGKNFVLTDKQGNIIQMTAEKITSNQPPPLLVTSTTASSTVTTKPTTKKLVRIAPISHKTSTTSASRSSQSLLIDTKTPVLAATSVSIEEFNNMVDQKNLTTFDSTSYTGEETIEQPSPVEEMLSKEPDLETVDVKPTLASLISNTAAEQEVHDMPIQMEEVEIEYESTPNKQERYTEEDNSNSMEHNSTTDRADENLIIVPSTLSESRHSDDHTYRDDTSTTMNDSRDTSKVNDESENIISYMTPQMDLSYTDSVYNMYDGTTEGAALRPRKACNCTKSQCLKLYCDCFANGEFCNKCNCNNCHNNLDNEEPRQKAIRACLERNPNAFRPKIGKAKSGGPEIIRRHNKGCNCKRSGCLKNYCECYEAKIACTMMCKCVGCRNVEETLERRRDADRTREKVADTAYRVSLPRGDITAPRQPCSFMTPEVIEAVAQCMLATVTERRDDASDLDRTDHPDPIEDILLEFSRCMADIISASHHQL